MKVQFPEPVNPEVLYERTAQFEDLTDDELEDLINGIGGALDLVCEKLKDRKFSLFTYQITFYKGSIDDENHLGVLDGGANLSARENRVLYLNSFRKKCQGILERVRKNYSGGSLGLDALIIGCSDFVPVETEAFDPFSRN